MLRHLPEPVYPALRVQNLLSEEARLIALRLLEGEAGLEREVRTQKIQKPGLVLAGYRSYLRADRIQVFGGSEMQYLRDITPEKRREVLEPVFAPTVPAIVVTKDVDPTEEVRFHARENALPLFATPHSSSVLIFRLTTYLEEKLAPRITLHGVMIEVFGVGILILGESGIGKSECALNLVSRGHRLVGDDVVNVKRRESGVLMAEGKDLVRQNIELRGLGIVNVRDLFGFTAVKRRKEVELIIQLEGWKNETDYERLGVEHEHTELMGFSVPLIRVPVMPGRNLAVLIEVAARNHILIRQGRHPAREVERKVLRAIKGKAADAAANAPRRTRGKR